MSVIYCPECGKEISVEEKKCPYCGYPIPQDIIMGTDFQAENSGFENDKVSGSKAKSKKPIIFAVAAVAVLLLGVGIFLGTANIRKYYSASRNLENKKYTEALEVFEELKDYKDSKVKVKECNYLMGKRSLDDSRYEESMEYFKIAAGYEDADDLYLEAEHGNKVAHDTIPPEFSKIRSEVSIDENEVFDIQEWAVSQSLSVTDDVTEDVEYIIDTGGFDNTKPGEYTVTFTASDEAGNTAVTEVTVKVRKVYTEAEILNIVYMDFPGLKTDTNNIVESVSYKQESKTLEIELSLSGASKILAGVTLGNRSKSEWKKITDSVDSLSANIKSCLTDSEVENVDAWVALLNDANKKNTLYVSCNGMKLADALD